MPVTFKNTVIHLIYFAVSCTLCLPIVFHVVFIVLVFFVSFTRTTLGKDTARNRHEKNAKVEKIHGGVD